MRYVVAALFVVFICIPAALWWTRACIAIFGSCP